MAHKIPPTCLAFAKHNHNHCLSHGLAEAKSHCAQHGLRLTKTRQRVLEILLESHKALGAYDILDRLKEEGLGGQPPVVYRALEFLTDNGFVHRLERLNAFTACVSPNDDHEAMFLICQDCLCVAETPQTALVGAMDQAADAVGFAVTSRMVEMIGQCPDCAQKSAP